MNPFRYGEIVTKSDFCARPALAKRLRGYLESEHNSVILGERRTGKTSLIVESVRRLRGLRLLYAQFWAVKSVPGGFGRASSSFRETSPRSIGQIRNCLRTGKRL
jgi:AAA+ ATPase superfamily predicted ATPase